jgi:hypothetical protein
VASAIRSRLGFANIKIKTTVMLASISIALGGSGLPLVLTGVAQAAPNPPVVYNNFPGSFPKNPTNIPSEGPEAYSYAQIGGQVELAGNERSNPTVTVGMSSWACQFGNWSTDNCSTPNPNTKFSWPITLNVYSVGPNNTVGSLIKSDTQTFAMPYRPSADTNGAGGCDKTQWYDSANKVCNHGLGFTVSFNLNGVTLPDDAIIGVSYDTSHYGPIPVGEGVACYTQSGGCFYDSLNVGLTDLSTNPIPSTGSYPVSNSTYGNYSFGSDYCDGGTGGINVFRLDSNCWTYQPTFEITASAATPTSKDQCKNGGWKQFASPTFKNEDQCVDWVEAHASGDLRMSGPSQRIEFSVVNKSGNEHGRNHVEYWNYDYPGGLHYSADVSCSYVNPLTNETRFMFQIPAGHSGLSGLYVVAYAKETSGKRTPDLYGHEATGDLATATQWCQSGIGFSPTMYPVTKGSVDVD